MKRILVALLAMVFVVVLFAGCGAKKEETNETATTNDQQNEAVENQTEDKNEATENQTEDKSEVENNNEKEVVGNVFENKYLTLTVPEGWTSNEDTQLGSVNLKKDGEELRGVMITFMENIGITADQYVEGLIKGGTGETAEKMTLGENEYSKIVSKTGEKETTLLITEKNNVLFLLTVDDFAGSDEQAILDSLKLK